MIMFQRALKAALLTLLPILVFQFLFENKYILQNFASVTSNQDLRITTKAYLLTTVPELSLLVILVGLPAFLFIGNKGRANWFTCTALGLVIAALSLILPELIRFLKGSSNYSLYAHGCQIFIDGQRTACGYAILGKRIAYFSALGAGTGLIFWIIYNAKSLARWRVVVSSFAVFTIGLVTYFQITLDLSCHNWSHRYGITSIKPFLTFEFRGPESDWPEIGDTLENYAQRSDLSSRNTSHNDAGIVNVLSYSLCDDEGYYVSVLEQHWKRGHFSEKQDDIVHVAFYQIGDREPPNDKAGELMNNLGDKWPEENSFSFQVPPPKNVNSQSK